jgi:23S rRNA pseudouridine1911/1915/1917 synthase
MAVVAGGRAATTDYEVLGAGGGYTLLHLEPRTGRTHQLRAHLAYLGLPIAGDLRYGGGLGPADLRRQFLHAAELAFRRPSDDARVETWSPLPSDLAASLGASTIVARDLPVASGSRIVREAENGGAVA